MGRLLMDTELIDKCLDLYCKSGLTRKNYKVDLLKIKKYIEEKNISLDELKHEDIKLFFNEYEKKYATESVNRCKNAISFLYRYLVKNDYLDSKSEKVISDLERKIPNNKQEKYLNKNEIKMFLEFLKNAPRQRNEQVKTFLFSRSRDLFLFELLIHRGIRSTETSLLKLSYINIEQKRIFIPKEIRKNGNNKYGLDLSIILDDNLIDLYKKYIIEREKISTDNDYVFVKPNGNPLFIHDKKNNTYTAGGTLTSILRKRIKNFNMYNMIVKPSFKPIDETLSIHCLRHTAVYYLRTEHGLNNYQMARMLGQKSIESQRKYEHIRDEDIEEKLNSNI